jgi:predicted PurR-regulated permease PerM
MPLYLALLFAILTVAGIYVLVALRHVLLILFISVLFASAVSGPAARLERLRIPRAIAALMIYLTALAILVFVGWLVAPTLLEQIAQFGEQAPVYLDRFDGLRDRYEDLRGEYPGLAPFDQQVARVGERIIDSAGDRLLGLPSTIFALFLDVLSVFVISMLLITNREKLFTFVISLVRPDHRDEWSSVLVKMWQRVGHYLRAKLIVSTIVGTITWVALLVIGVPYAILLAIVVAFGEVIPRAGPWIARIPLLAIAGLEGPATLGLTFGASVVIENAKGYLISPWVEGDQLDIHPLLVFIAVLIGGALLGVAGAFIAVPAAAMVQVIVEEIVLPWRQRQIGEAPAAQAGARDGSST